MFESVVSPFVISIVSESDEVCTAQADAFAPLAPQVKVIKGEIADEKFQCWVANGTSFGLLAGSRIIKYKIIYCQFIH